MPVLCCRQTRGAGLGRRVPQATKRAEHVTIANVEPRRIRRACATGGHRPNGRNAAQPGRSHRCAGLVGQIRELSVKACAPSIREGRAGSGPDGRPFAALPVHQSQGAAARVPEAWLSGCRSRCQAKHGEGSGHEMAHARSRHPSPGPVRSGQGLAVARLLPLPDQCVHHSGQSPMPSGGRSSNQCPPVWRIRPSACCWMIR